MSKGIVILQKRCRKKAKMPFIVKSRSEATKATNRASVKRSSQRKQVKMKCLRAVGAEHASLLCLDADVTIYRGQIHLISWLCSRELHKCGHAKHSSEQHLCTTNATVVRSHRDNKNTTICLYTIKKVWKKYVANHFFSITYPFFISSRFKRVYLEV